MPELLPKLDDFFRQALGQPETAPESGPAPTPEASRMDAFFKEAADDLNARTNSTLRRAQETDPDGYAETLKISEDTGLPPGVVERNPEAAKRITQRPDRTMTKLEKESPRTHTFVSKDENAKVAHDDLENLTLLEQIVQGGRAALQNYLRHTDTVATVFKEDVPEAMAQLAEDPAGAAQEFGEQFRVGMAQRRMLELAYQDFAEGLSPDDVAELNRLEEMVGGTPYGEFWTSSAARVLPGMIAGIQEAVPGALAAGGAAALLGQAGPQVALPEEVITVPAAAGAGFTAMWAADAVKMGMGEAYLELRAFRDENGQPLDREVLNAATLLVGMGVGLLDTAAVPYAARAVPGIDVARRLLEPNNLQRLLRVPSVREALRKGAFRYVGAVGAETLTEVAQEALLVLGGEVAKLIDDGQFEQVTGLELEQRVLQSAYEAFRAASVLAAPGSGVNATVDVSRARKAQQNQEVFKALGAASENSKLRARLPQRFRDFLQAARNGGAIENVGIASREFQQYFQDQNADPMQVASMLGVSNEDYQTSLATDSDLIVPVENYATVLAGGEHHQALSRHMRLDPEDMTLAEAEDFEANGLAADLDRAAARLETLTEDPLTRTEDLQVIQQEVETQLSEAGVDPQNAQYYSALVTARYGTRAQRLGTTPLELWRQDNVQIRGEAAPTLTARTVDELDLLIEAARTGEGPTQAEIFGPSLAEFVAERGGVRDTGGELEAAGGRDFNLRAGRGPMRPLLGEGRPDELALAAIEAGYIPEGSEGDALTAALGEELRGRPTFSPTTTNLELQERGQAISDLQEFLERQGVDITQATNEEIRQLVDEASISQDDPEGALYQITGVREGRETLEKYGLEPGRRYSTREIARALEARQAAKYGTIERNDRSEDAEKRIARWMRDEVLFEMRPGNEQRSGVGWYSGKYQQALDTFGAIYPELVDEGYWQQTLPPGLDRLETLQNARDFLTALIAVTSDGNRVYNNFALAATLYGQFRDTGQVPSTPSGGERTKSININLRAINQLLDTYGPEGMHDFLLHEDTVSNLKRTAKAEGIEFSASYPAKEKLPFAAITFGPKLGAFYANLMGAEGYLTMDRWWSRTFNRYRGTLLAQPTQQGLDRVKALIIEDRGLTMTPEEMTNEIALEMASDYVASYRAKGYKNGTEIERAANTVYKAATEQLEDQPFNTSDRGFMIRAVQRAKRSLKRAGHDLTIADIQAILWYYEKRLYSELGARATPDVSYAETAERVVREQSQAAREGRDLRTEGPVLERDDGDTVDTPDGNHVDAVSEPVEVVRELEQRYQDQGGRRGSFIPDQNIINLFRAQDLSTFLHESGHLFLEQFRQDVADQPDNLQLRRDAQILQRWFGVDLDQIGTEQHEQFARGFEAYLREGKAPSVELQNAFDRFMAWLTRIYRQLTQLDVELTDDVRGVMDRLLATDEQIAAVESIYEMDAFFGSAQEAGLSQGQYRSYLRAVERSRTESRRRLVNRQMSALQRETTREWRENEAAVREEVVQETNADPAYRALFHLSAGTLPDGTPLPADMQDLRLNREEVREILGSKAAAQRLPRIKRNVYARARDGGTLSADDVAALYGFSSGSEMLQTMMERPPYREFVNAETQVRMRERYGDRLANTTEAALQATHNDRRGDVLARELNILAEGREQIRAPVVRQWARTRIQDLQLDDVRPSKFLAAERRAAVKAGRALGKGDRVEAMRAKADQLLNHYLAQESYRVQREIEKNNRYLRKFQNRRKKFPGIDAAYLDRIRTLMEAYQLGPRLSERKRTILEMQTLAAWVGALEGDNSAKEQYISIVRESNKAAKALGLDTVDPEAQLADDETTQIVIPREILQADNQTHWRDMKLSDYRGLVDSIRNLEHQGRLKKKWRLAKEARAFDEIANEVIDRIDDTIKKPKSQRTEERPFDYVGNQLRNFLAALRKTENLTHELDGFEEQGPVWTYIYKPLNDAADQEVVRVADATKRLAQIWKPYSSKERANMVWRQEYYRELDDSFSKAAILSIALNWGNQGNRDALLEGYGWTEENVQTVLDRVMDKRDWDFVQGIWDLIDDFWPEIADLERRTAGVAPEKVEATAVQTRFGNYDGGYYPLKYDSRLDERQRRDSDYERMKQLFGGAYARAATRHGHTIERTGSGGRPVTLSLDVIDRHLTEVIHDLTHREPMMHVDRLIRRGDVTGAIKRAKGVETYRALEQWIRDIAAGDQLAPNAIDRMMRHFRGGMSIASMGLKLTTALVQFTGYTQTVARLSRNGQFGEYWAMRGLMDYVRDPYGHFKKNSWVFDKSSYMRDRARSMDREIRDYSQSALAGNNDVGKAFNFAVSQADRATGGRLPHWMAAPKMQNAWFYFIQTLDNVVATASWMAGYEQGLNLFDGDDARAVAHADGIVRESQSSGYMKDLAGVQRGGELLKLFTAFYSYFSSTYNLMLDEFRRYGQNPRKVKNLPRMLMNMAWLTFLPAVLAEMILGQGPDEDDDESWAEWTAKVTGYYVVSSVPVVREVLGSLFSDYPARGPAVISAFTDASKAVSGIVQGDIDRRSVQRAAFRTTGIFFHLPTGQAFTIVDGLQRAADGEDLTPFEMLVKAPPP